MSTAAAASGPQSLTPGTIFDTPFEKECEVITEPDEQGNFDAYDSERVVCSFCTVMVVGHPDFREPK